MEDNIYTKPYFTVGEVSEISNLSKKSLRFYDEKGLLSPSLRGENNYRYYSNEQVQDAIVISALKLRGLTLSEILDLFDGERPSTEKIYESLNAKAEDLRVQIDELQKQLEQTQNTTSQIVSAIEGSRGDGASSDEGGELEIAWFPEKTVVYTRYKSYNNANQIWWDRTAEIYRLAAEGNHPIMGALGAIYHDHYLNQFFFDYGDMEVFLPIPEDTPVQGNVKHLGGYTVARKVYQGLYSGLLPVYVSLVKEIEDKGCRIVGPAMEEYLVDFMHGAEESACITRVSFPIEPVAMEGGE